MKIFIFVLICLHFITPCQGEPNSVQGIPGDISGNGIVDFVDFSMMGSDWLKSTRCEPNVIQEWAARYDGPGSYDDRAYAIATDNFGNVYITGQSWGSGTGDDYATVKYDTNGVQLWVARYSEGEYAYAMTTDNSGNVYVTGLGHDPSLGWIYATVKYNSDGNELWVARYNGLGNGWNESYAIAVDDSKNVYVTGYSEGNDTGYDYATVKYDPNGNELWASRYNGPGNESDIPVDIISDVFGNVYVTGYSKGIDTGYDYATIKYDPNGNELWVARYDNRNGNDYAKALDMDSFGNIYITGNDGDYVTVKYDPNGNRLWAANYHNGSEYAYDIVIDNSDYVYVTGMSSGSGTSYDYATVKYDPNGNQIWVKRYDGGAGGWERATSIAIDSNGNIYVTGYSYVSAKVGCCSTIKYDPNGNQLWVAKYNGLGDGNYEYSMAVGTDGGVYVAAYIENPVTYDDYAIVKYDSNGDQLWSKTYDASAHYGDYARDIAIDDTGNVYVTGYSWGAGSYYDYFTIKYDVNGSELWSARYNGPDNYYDYAEDIAIDSCGNIYITGRSYGSGGFDYTTIKYDPNGKELWAARYNSGGGYDDCAEAIAIDSSDNIYVTGNSESYGNNVDYATVKYDPNGNQLWVARYDEAAGDYGQAIIIDNHDNIYVAGKGYMDWAIIKYNTNGNQLWVTRTYTTSDASVSDMAIDRFGNIYVVGNSNNSGNWADYLTIKYNPNGAELWRATYAGPSSDYAEDIAIDSYNNVYVTGYSYSSDTSADYLTIKYDQNGNQLWVARYNSPCNSYDMAYAIALDSSDNIYVTGGSAGSYPGSNCATSSDGEFAASVIIGSDLEADYTTIKYDPNGTLIWLARYKGLDANVAASAIALDRFNNVYVTGNSSGHETYHDYATVKYTPVCNCIPEILGDVNNDCKIDITDLAILATYWLEGNTP